MFVAENFVRPHIEKYGRHIVYTDGGGTLYTLQVCRFLHLRHYLHSALQESLVERAIQYFKDKTECFDDF